jgi:hypothetical protein
LRIEPGNNLFDDLLPMHHPAEHDVFDHGTFDEVVQQKANVFHDHRLGFRRSLHPEKRCWVTWSSTIGKSWFPHAHRSADQKQVFHCRPPKIRSMFTNIAESVW